MSERPDVTTHFCEVVSPLVDGRCYPVVQFGAESAYPAIVYYGLTLETVTTLDGPHATGLTLRYECRAHDYDTATDLSKQVLSALRAGGRLIRLGAGLDDYDEALSIYRRIQSVTLNR